MFSNQAPDLLLEKGTTFMLMFTHEKTQELLKEEGYCVLLSDREKS